MQSENHVSFADMAAERENKREMEGERERERVRERRWTERNKRYQVMVPRLWSWVALLVWPSFICRGWRLSGELKWFFFQGNLLFEKVHCPEQDKEQEDRRHACLCMFGSACLSVCLTDYPLSLMGENDSLIISLCFFQFSTIDKPINFHLIIDEMLHPRIRVILLRKRWCDMFFLCESQWHTS